MMQDATDHEARKDERLRTHDQADARNGVDGSKNKHASFIDKMNRGIYTEHEEKLEDRLTRNIHFIQRKTGETLGHDEAGIV